MTTKPIIRLIDRVVSASVALQSLVVVVLTLRGLEYSTPGSSSAHGLLLPIITCVLLLSLLLALIAAWGLWLHSKWGFWLSGILFLTSGIGVLTSRAHWKGTGLAHWIYFAEWVLLTVFCALRLTLLRDSNLASRD